MRLTDALVAPSLGAGDVRAWGRAVESTPRVLGGMAGAGRARVTAHEVRVALGGGREGRPFAWSAVTAARPLGLAALQSLLFGASRTPAEAVREVVAAGAGRGGGWFRPPSQLDRWLAGLAPAGRAAVGAAAVTWTTRLWSALDWDALPTPLVLGRDHWWDSPHGGGLALRSRAEVRCGSADLVLLTGARRESARHELSLVTLVEALRTPEAAPRPVVGWWPDSGHLIRVEPEPAVLDLGVAAVAAVLRGRRQAAA
jgi:hypothetical protein